MMSRALNLALVVTLLCSLVACNFKSGNNEQMNWPGQPDITTPEGAREKLSQLNVPYTIDEFVNRAKQSDVVAVNLFLTAGMNPNARDNDDNTALIAAKKAGHEDIVQLLKEIDAEK